MSLFNFWKKEDKTKSYTLSEKELRWNKFIEEICCSDRELSSLSETQKMAVLCFWYDSEMQNGGFCQYQDNYPEIDPIELKEALATIGNDEIVRNYSKALEEGEQDDWEETDAAYGRLSPSLCDLLQDFVEKHKEEIFK